MVVGDDVGVPVLRLVHLQVRVVPGELLAWLDRLVLLGELVVVVGFQVVNVFGKSLYRNGRVRNHG